MKNILSIAILLCCGLSGAYALYLKFVTNNDPTFEQERVADSANTIDKKSASGVAQTSHSSTGEVTTTDTAEVDLCSAIIRYATNGASKEHDFSVSALRSCIDAELREETASADRLSLFLRVWAEIDILDALTFAANLNDAIRPYVLPSVVQKATSIDAQSVERWITSQNLEGSFEITQAFYLGRTKIDPLSVLDDILNLPSNNQSAKDDKLVLFASALEKWAEKDALEAMKWLEQGKSNRMVAKHLESLEINLMMKLMEQDDRAAEAKIMALENSPHKALMIEKLAQHLAEFDEELAVDWAQSLSDPDSRKSAVSAAIQYWTDAGVPAEKVIDLILTESNEAARQGITNDAVISLAGRNSEELADLYLQLPPEEHPHVVEKIANSWVNSDHNGASEWINSLPSGEAKDAAIYSIVTDGLSNFDHPGLALEMASGIFEKGVRFHASKTILQNVAQNDLDAAHAMLSEISSLSEVEIKEIENALPKRPK